MLLTSTSTLVLPLEERGGPKVTLGEAVRPSGAVTSQIIKRALVRYVRDPERRQAALERFDRIRAKIPPEQRLSEEEALRLADEEKAAMRAERDQAEAD